MARWLVFASWKPDDPALWNSHWIAQQTVRIAPTPPAVIERDQAVRESLEIALADEELEGVVLFGHGRPHAVLGADGREALDAANVRLIGARWAHAMACLTGLELVPGSAEHVDFFVGYHVPLVVEWDLSELTDELHELLTSMVTATTLGLLAGVRETSELQRRVARAADALTDWLLMNTEEGYLGLHVFAQQLVDRMVVSGREHRNR